MIVIVDYGLGNVGSIANMLKRIGAEVIISSKDEEIHRADKLILPGVGSFDEGMERLKASGLIPILEEKVLSAETPLLGICLGMQLLTKESEEGSQAGLGWIDAQTVRFCADGVSRTLRLPHMGWNSVSPKKETDLFVPIDGEIRFYFLHSYHVICHNEDDVLSMTNYGYDFVSSFQKDHIIGVQFHPEKSHRFGMNFMKHFAKW